MAYVSVEHVARVRKTLKETFPRFKISVTRHHYSSINVNIMEGPIDFGLVDAPVNHYHIKDSHNGEAQEMLLKVKEIANKGNYIVSTDSDYGNIPDFYLNVNIGKWDKPYVKVA